MTQFNHSTGIQAILDRLGAGDARARDEILARSFERLRLLARRMFHQQPQLRELLQTDDVLQGAAIRLHRALADVTPDSVRGYFGLASQQIRRELIDLVRRHLGEDGNKARQLAGLGAGSNGHDRVLEQREAPSTEPTDLAQWSDFHEAIQTLPDEEREVVHLLYYQGLQQSEAAAVMQVSVRQVKRIWQRARLLLSDAMHGDAPAL